MKPMYSANIATKFGEKTIDVFACDIRDFDRKADILTISSFVRNYIPTPGTMFAALESVGIDVELLSAEPEFDFRELCNIWVSEKISGSDLNIERIACVEMRRVVDDSDCGFSREEDVLKLIKAFFKMLDFLSAANVKAESVAMPLIGAGCQGIDSEITVIPIINECIDFLKNNEHIKNFYFVDYDASNAFKIAAALMNSYSILSDKSSSAIHTSYKGGAGEGSVFISYSTPDRNVADNLCAKLEAKGLKVWYAPRNIYGSDYASAIVKAISECTHFVVIISKNSMMSQHVLNEIDLAFNELNRNIKFLPMRIDIEELRPAFSYYLSRQHWMDAHIPPIEKRLDEFVVKISSDIS